MDSTTLHTSGFRQSSLCSWSPNRTGEFPSHTALQCEQANRHHRWLGDGYRLVIRACSRSKRQGYDSELHGEDERLDLERTSPGLLFLLIGFSATFPRPRMTVRRTGPVWGPAGRDAGVLPSYHAGLGAAQEQRAEKARSQSTSMMKPFYRMKLWHYDSANV